MNPFRCLAAVLALSLGVLTLPAQAQVKQSEVVSSNPSGDPVYNADAPKGYSMIGDLLFARPMLIGLTALGTAAFVVSLPFSALGGNVGESAQALVLDPGREAFVRCLGCTSSQSNAR